MSAVAGPVDDEILAEIEAVPRSADPASERHRQAERLVRATGSDRRVLEGLRTHYLERLHRASDDFAATEALRVVEAALSMLPPPSGAWDWQRKYL